jgi:hypothetical protein
MLLVQVSGIPKKIKFEVLMLSMKLLVPGVKPEEEANKELHKRSPDNSMQRRQQ